MKGRGNMQIMNYIQSNWVEWLFAALFFVIGAAYRYLYKRMMEQKTEHDERMEIERQKNDAIMQGIQSLLRESIISNYNKYQDLDYCPIYAKESVKRVYESYHDLGGNDVATTLYEKLLAMTEEKEEDE